MIPIVVVKQSKSEMIKTIFVFIIASGFEIAGCYFIWQWIKNNKSFENGVLGILFLALYGVVATFQTAIFAKVYVVYGGVFIIMSILWACFFDTYKPDLFDIGGIFLVAVGIALIYFVPRK